MRIARAAAFTLAAAAAGAALAQDTNPPVAPAKPPAENAASTEKHVNKITDAAKEVFAKFDKIMYSPVKLGLKELTGTVKMEMDLPEEARSMMPGMDLSFSVTFKAPDVVEVTPKEAPGGEAGGAGGMGGGAGAGGMGGMMGGMKRQMTKGVAAVVRYMIGVYKPADDSEYDADATTVDGKTVLTITSYKNNAEVVKMDMTLSPEGLPDVGVVKLKEKDKEEPPAGGRPGGMHGRGGQGGAGDGKVTIHFFYGKEGDRWRLDRMTTDVPGAPGTVDQVLSYTDTEAGMKLCHRWTSTVGTMPKFGYRFTEMTANGKAVTLPKEEGETPPK